MAAAVGDPQRLERRIAGEGRFGLFRLFDLQIAGAEHMQPIRREQFDDLADLAGIVACHHQRVAARKRHAPSTLL